MRKTDVLAHFDGNQSAVARALEITRASVNAWPDLVPELSARRLHEYTRGKLRFNSSLYDKAKGRQSATAAGART
jgi:hypothetical protein